MGIGGGGLGGGGEGGGGRRGGGGGGGEGLCEPLRHICVCRVLESLYIGGVRKRVGCQKGYVALVRVSASHWCV